MPAERFVAKNRVMRALVDQIRRFARSSSNVLISGETGTGKNAIARQLHVRGPRARRAFGFEASVGFREGLARTIAWYREHHAGRRA